MFRESDVSDPRYHSTYVNKPLPVLQRQQQTSKFDERSDELHQFSRRPGDGVYDPVPDLIPCAVDTVYDPSHVDADWTGLVLKEHHKRHVRDHTALNVGLQHTEQGISSNIYREEYGRKRRIDVPASKSNPNILGGIDIDDSDRWKSNYQRFSSQESTISDQYTLSKQHVQKHQYHNTSMAQSQQFIDEESYRSDPRTYSQSRPSQTTKYGSNSKFVAFDLSASVLESLKDQNLPVSKPRVMKANSTLILDNYSSQLPGEVFADSMKFRTLFLIWIF